MAELPLVDYTVEDEIAIIRISNPPVNALSGALRRQLHDAVLRGNEDPDAQAIVVAAEGRTFIGGADIKEFGKPPSSPVLPELIGTLDQVAKPIVAAINGAALGGGLELALGCHARIATPNAKLGLPEVKLGLLPGAGGTQRLPRLIGAAVALKIMGGGQPITAIEAEALGLVDKVFDDDLIQHAKQKAHSLVGKPLRRTRCTTAQGSREAFEQAAAALMKRYPDNPSIEACIDSVRATFDLSFDRGLEREREHFLRLVDDPRSKALRHVFFAERQAARLDDPAASADPRKIESAAIIGGGTMGGGIAMCFANAGIPVTIIETSEQALHSGLERISQNYNISVQRGSLTEQDRDKRVKLIDGKATLDGAAQADIVIEAVFEDISVKRDIFGSLGQIAKPGAILATNTSYLDVNDIADASGRPQDVLGMHFFSPANVMKLLEVVRGSATAPDVLATAMRLAPKLGKIPVAVGVCHGFVGNRMLAVRNAQGERLLLEGALPQDIDRAMTTFGFRMGPFAVSDLAGLDIGWHMRKATGKSAPVADALCEAGRFGQKTGKGYYLYSDGDRTPHLDADVTRIIEDIAAERGVTRRTVSDKEIVERLIYPMINEGARILEEGIAARSGDIDIVWLYGYGWPASRGGPMYYADQVGLSHVADRLEDFAALTGQEELRPSPLLKQLATDNQDFKSFSVARSS